MRKLSLLLVAVVLIVIATTSNATAAQRFLPGGLPQSSPSAAARAALNYASLNDSYAKVLALQTGVSSYNVRDYQTVGWGKAPADTRNSALTGGGSMISYKDPSSVGVKTVRIRNRKTGIIVNIMVRCGNPRIKSGVPVVPKVKVRKILKIWVNRTVKVKRTITCPTTKQKVTGTATVTVKGWFSTRVKGWATGAHLWYKQQVDLKVTERLVLTCAPPPSVTPVTPPPAVVISCPTGWQIGANGNCVVQSNDADQRCKARGGSYDSVDQTCTIIQVNADCSNIIVINGDGNVVNTTQEGNCNTNVTPPPPANRPPVVELVNPPQHVYVGGRAQICALTTDPDGDSITVTWYAVRGTVSTAFQPDPAGNPNKWCTRYNAPSTAGSDTVSVTVSDGEYSVSDGTSFPIPADDFGSRSLV